MKSQTNIMGVPQEETTLSGAIALEVVDMLRDTYLPWIEKALGHVSRDIVWQRPRKGVNSIGNLMLHLAGNVRQWIQHGIGGAEDHRERQIEFDTDDGADVDELFRALKQTVLEACDVILKPRSEEEWLKTTEIQGYTTTPLSAIIHVMEHFSYHTGQIVLLVKSATGQDMGFYDLDE